MIGASMAARAPRTRGLGQMAMDAIRRNGGTLLLPGAATPNGDGTFSHGNPPLRNYLDSTGTDILDSVTQVDQPVGLCLDSMGVLGPELAPGGGTFDSATGWIAATGWSISGGIASFAVADVASRTIVFSGAVAGKTYEVTCDVTRTAGTYSFFASNIGSDTGGVTASGPRSCILTADVTGNISFLARAGFTGSIDNISVREIPGNHASQQTTANKGILRRTSGRYRWEFDATDSLVVTLPAGFNAATTIDARSTGHVTLQNQNIVGAYSIGPSITSFGRIILPSSPSASDLALLQRYANWLAGVSA